MAERSGIQTHFKDAIVPTPEMGGDWGGTKGGDTSFQGAEKGTAGKIPEVTFVDVAGAPGPGASAKAGSEIATTGKR